MWRILSIVFGSLLVVAIALSAVYYSTSSSKIHDYQGVIADIQNRIGDLPASGIPAEISSLQDQLASAKRTISTLQGDAGSYKAQVSSLQDANTGYKSQIASLQNDNASYKSQIASLQSQLTSGGSQLQSLQTQIISLQSQLTSANARNDTLQGIVSLSQFSTKANAVTINQSAGQSSVVVTFTADYAGYIVVSGTSTTSNGYLAVADSFSGYPYGGTQYSFGTGASRTIPVLPGTVTVYFGNTNFFSGSTATITVIYYY